MSPDKTHFKLKRTVLLGLAWLSPLFMACLPGRDITAPTAGTIIPARQTSDIALTELTATPLRPQSLPPAATSRPSPTNALPLDATHNLIKEQSMDAQEVIKQYEAGERDFRGIDLSEVDLSGINLSQADLSQANLSTANLSQANLSEVNLSQANLSGAILKSADLSQANLTEANLSWADLFGANLNQADLSRADMSMAIMIRTRLQGATMPDGSKHQ